MKRIGIMALQGSVQEHETCLQLLGINSLRVKTPGQLEEIDGLILPGGESTTMSILLNSFGIMEPLRRKIQDRLPVWGTCAGMILLAKKITDQDISHLGVMDVEARRNAYGGQLDSFRTVASIPAVSAQPVPLVYIRAPYIEKVWSDTEILHQLEGKITAARQHNMLATAFHPELTGDLSFYNYFIRMVSGE